MPEVKRGFRKVTCIIPLAAFQSLQQMGEKEMRTVDQQAAYLLLKMVNGDQVEASVNGKPIDERADAELPGSLVVTTEE